mgnify:CR=1 FL=1
MQDVEKTDVELEINPEVEQDNQHEEVETIDWKAEALKQTAIANRLKKKLSSQPINNPKQELEDDVVKTVNRLALLEEKRQFGFDNNLSPQETDYAFKFANGKPTKDILEDPFFRGGLESLRSKQRIENNTPGSSSRSAIFSEKSFSDLTEEDRKKTFEAKMKNFKR